MINRIFVACCGLRAKRQFYHGAGCEPRNIGVDRIALATGNNTARQQDQDEEDRERGGKRKT